MTALSILVAVLCAAVTLLLFAYKGAMDDLLDAHREIYQLQTQLRMAKRR